MLEAYRHRIIINVQNVVEHTAPLKEPLLVMPNKVFSQYGFPTHSGSTGYNAVVGIDKGQWPSVLPSIDLPVIRVDLAGLFGEAAKQ